MKVITINNEAFFNKYLELKGLIEVKPDMIVGILSGAECLINNFKQEKDYKSVIFKLVTLQRRFEVIKSIGVFRALLKVLPYKILDNLRIFESIKAKKQLEKIDLRELSNQKIDFDLESISTNLVRNILVVDDAVDSGVTMFLIKNNLSNLFPDANIEVAVISWTNEKSIVKPDYYLFKNVLVRFPWSKDYKGKNFD